MVQLSGILLRFLLILDESEDMCKGGALELVLAPGVVAVCMLGLLETEDWVMDAMEGTDEL